MPRDAGDSSTPLTASSLPPSDPIVNQPLLDGVLNRPAHERVREFKYRFAQSVVFGLPVLALQIFGHTLGGADSARWVGLLQVMLTGWVCYVAAAGMLFEGALILLRERRLTADGSVALAAVLLYAVSCANWLSHLFPFATPLGIMRFHAPVLLLIAWTGWQWRRWSGRALIHTD